MQTIAELLREGHIGRYAGSFFFARDVAGRNDGTQLFSTLAHQIATNLPGMRKPINEAMKLDQTLPTKSMDVQLQSLIIDPLAQSSYFLHQPTIIIDGLDECHSSDTQRDILSLISSSITNSRVPLRFLIASRPECWIDDSFKEVPLFDLTKRISMSNLWDANEDIKKYLKDGFAEIYSRHLDLMSGVNSPWPSEEAINDFALRASGQFIYASTVLKFVGSSSEFVAPHRQLQAICAPGPLQGQAFSQLDQLYARVLSVHPAREVLVSVLGGLLSNATLKTIEVLMNIDRVDIKITLRVIACLIDLYPSQMDQGTDNDSFKKLYGLPGTNYEFCHLSFREFLEDKSRSGSFSVDVQAVCDTLCDKLFDTLVDMFNGIKQPRNVTIVECDQMWRRFAAEISGDVSPTKLQHNIERLLRHISEFLDDDRRILQIWPDDLLRPLEYVKALANNLRDDSPPFRKHFGIDEGLLDELDEEIPKLQVVLIRQILSNNNLSSHPIIPYIINDSVNYTLTDLCSLPFIGNEVATTFLLKNAHIIENNTWDPWLDCSDKIQTYSLMDCFRYFLTSLVAGVTFQREFRAQYIRTALPLLKWFCRVRGTISELQFPYGTRHMIYGVIRTFFESSQYSDIQSQDDLNTAEDIIDTLSNCHWVYVNQSEVLTYSCVGAILCWLFRYMNHPQSAYGSQKLLDIAVRVYHNIIVPMISQKFFSELLVYDATDGQVLSLSLIYPTSHKGEVFTTENASHLKEDLPAYCLTEYYGDLFCSISPMTRILIESEYIIPISLSEWFTHLTEFYLHTLFKYQWYRLHNHITPRLEVDLDLLLVHLQPTKKILTALREILYLGYLKTGRGWWGPPGFASFAMELLKKFDLDEQEYVIFASILEDLVLSESNGERSWLNV